ncbi:MAG: phospholipid/cholesterol/gamma-HCH transport system substrate-binding protein [Actinomycetota bacterium]|nr:phospholipid/cholesterol/gamma-HCH transport system substrate-binding protein [Actinomycetota bacterium]
MSKYRTLINVLTFLVASALLIYFGGRNLVFQQEAGRTLHAIFTDASGLLPRNDVTMRGVPVGTVDDVALTDEQVRVDMVLDPGVRVPEGTKAEIVRRSPIGELTIELDPGQGAALDDDATIDVADTRPPPDVSTTIKVLADVLHEVPSADLHTVVNELATAVNGRSADIARFSEDAADLPERLLQVQRELRNLIVTSPKLTGVLADNANVLADDITQTADLAEILRDRRFDLLELYRNGARFTEVANGILTADKANITCFIRDSGTFNAKVVSRKADLVAVLETNHWFFDGVDEDVQADPDPSRGTWFRVSLLPHTEPQGRSYQPHRPTPDVYGANGCTSMYGPGVGPGTQAPAPILPPDSKLHLGH